jgi:hypothetical protein
MTMKTIISAAAILASITAAHAIDAKQMLLNAAYLYVYNDKCGTPLADTDKRMTETILGTATEADLMAAVITAKGRWQDDPDWFCKTIRELMTPKK